MGATPEVTSRAPRRGVHGHVQADIARGCCPHDAMRFHNLSGSFDASNVDARATEDSTRRSPIRQPPDYVEMKIAGHAQT